MLGIRLKHMMHIRCVCLVLALCAVPTLTKNDSRSTTTEQYDVLVYAANAAGVGAAVTASNNGQFTVKVMEPLRMIGGMAAAGGVALMNQGCGMTGVTGLAKNWSMLCAEHYYGYYGEMMTFPSMAVSEMAFWKLLNSSASINTTTGCRAMQVARGAAPGCLSQVNFLCDNDTVAVNIQASYIIDASYDGDIMTLAGGIDYTYGREPQNAFNESYAGINLDPQSLESFEGQGLSVSPYFANGTLLPYINEGPMPAKGTGDDKVMAYQYFACLSPTAGNQVPFYKPANYNADDFTLLLRQIEGLIANKKYPNGPPLGYFGAIQCYDDIVEQKTGNRDCLFCCGTGPVDADQPDLNHGWPVANHSRRLEMAQAHRYYIQGSLYFMATDPRVPAYTRNDTNRYGYCKDEYAEFGNFPPQLYVRISNRLQGESLLTQNNIANPRIKPDGVAMGCWEFDQHTMSRHAVPSKDDPSKKVVTNEGFFRYGLGPGGNWYDVPFGVMVPKRGQASNLLVPVTISATSVAYASTRIENMFMDLGSAAGVAVAQLLNRHARGHLSVGACPSITVQDANVTAVQAVLHTVYGQRVHGPPGNNPPPPPAPLGPIKYSVHGAGTAVWNGDYRVALGKRQDNRAVYVNTNCSDCALYSYANTWRLAVLDKEIYYVAGHPTAGGDPPLTGWTVANATAPAPTLVAKFSH